VSTFEVGHISSGDSPIADIGRQPAEGDPPVRLGGDVVDDPDAVAQALRPAELERLPDRGEPEGLAGVDREVEVLVSDQLEGVEVPGRRVSRLRSRDVEAEHPGVAVTDRQLGDLDRARRLAHGAQQQAGDGRPALRAAPDSGSGRFDHLVQAQALAQVLLRSEPDLGVHDPVVGQVLPPPRPPHARSRRPFA